jgi:hypothetical protein
MLLYGDGSPKGKSINFFGDPTSGTTIYNCLPAGPGVFLLNLYSSPNYTVEIKKISFIESPNIPAGSERGHLAFRVYGGYGESYQPQNWGKPFLIHDCTFTATTGDNLNQMWGVWTPIRAVVWNCTFNGTG